MGSQRKKARPVKRFSASYSTVFEAKHEGDCAECQGRIKTGDFITLTPIKRQPIHPKCRPTENEDGAPLTHWAFRKETTR